MRAEQERKAVHRPISIRHKPVAVKAHLQNQEKTMDCKAR